MKENGIKKIERQRKSPLETVRLAEKNPVLFSDEKTEAVEEAYTTFVKILDEYIKERNISEEEVLEIRKTIRGVYLNRKASLILQGKLHDFVYCITNLVTNAFENQTQKGVVKSDCNKFLYYNNKRHFMSNEQY